MPVLTAATGRSLNHRVKLGLDQRGRELLGHGDCLGILGGHRRDHRPSEAAIGRDRAQVGLYPRSAAGVPTPLS